MTSRSTAPCTLLADIGGTNSRFALMDAGEIGPVSYARVVDFATVHDAMADFLDRAPPAGAWFSAVLAVAGPLVNDRCVMTNSPWIIDGPELRTAFGFDAVHMLNDFEAQAWAPPALRPSDLFALGADRHRPASQCWCSGPGPALASPAWSSGAAPASP